MPKFSTLLHLVFKNAPTVVMNEDLRHQIQYYKILYKVTQKVEWGGAG